MQLSLKAHYLSKCVDKKALEALFEMLEKNNIEYKPLAIPVSSLDIDKYIDPQEFSHVVESSEFRGIIQESIIFDFYLPEFGYIFKLERLTKASYSGVSDEQRLQEMVNESVLEAYVRARDLQSLVDSTTNMMWNYEGELSFLEKATMDYLDSKGIRALFSATDKIVDSFSLTDDRRGPIAVDKIPALEAALIVERLRNKG